MVEILICVIIFILLSATFAAIINAKSDKNPYTESINKIKKVKESKYVKEHFSKKQIQLKRLGADIFIKDGITVGQWYLYKLLFCVMMFMVTMLITLIFSGNIKWLAVMILTILGYFVLDIYLKLKNKSSNEEMVNDIMEMSRSVLYGKRGGQYISDALKDSVMVVENKRLKLSLIRLRNNLEAGMSIDESLEEFELSFSCAEISAFCTVIKSLQSTGQVDESLKVLEKNIEREQVSVNKKRCVMLENKTMFYVMLLAFDILALILYCVIMKLLELQIGF